MLAGDGAEAQREAAQHAAPAARVRTLHGQALLEQVDHPVPEVLLAAHVAVERHRLHPELGPERAHRAGLEAAGIDQPQGGLDDAPARERRANAGDGHRASVAARQDAPRGGSAGWPSGSPPARRRQGRADLPPDRGGGGPGRARVVGRRRVVFNPLHETELEGDLRMTRIRHRRLTRMFTGVLSALALVLLPVGTGVGAAAPEAASIPLSQALDLLASGGVDSARIVDRGGTDTLVLFGDDRRLTTPLPDALSDRALEAARDGGVALSVQLPPAPKAPLPIDTGGAGSTSAPSSRSGGPDPAGRAGDRGRAWRCAGGQRPLQEPGAPGALHDPLRRGGRDRRDPRRGHRDRRLPARPGALRAPGRHPAARA